jgi:hypothetical protein
MKRTEADILSKRPIEVTFGDKQYSIKLLTLRPARDWRRQVHQQMGNVLSSFGGDVKPENMHTALNAAMIAFPERLLDLVMAFAPDLPREEIEENATDEQLAIAYGKLMAVGFPFLAPLMMTQRVLAAAATQ